MIPSLDPDDPLAPDLTILHFHLILMFRLIQHFLMFHLIQHFLMSRDSALPLDPDDPLAPVRPDDPALPPDPDVPDPALPMFRLSTS
jgi:hypothetical protein